MGWGGFNLVEGIVDHQILGIHHVRDDLGGPIGWDLAFLAWGAGFLAGGWLLSRLSMQGAASTASIPDGRPAALKER
jgi:uncharacterized membrane protein